MNHYSPTPVDFAQFKFVDATPNFTEDSSSCTMATTIVIVVIIMIIFASIGGCMYKRGSYNMNDYYISGRKAEVAAEKEKDVHVPSVEFDKDCKNLTSCKEGDSKCMDIKKVDQALMMENAKKIMEELKLHEKMVILIYAPWCPHCHKAMPSFIEASKINPTSQYVVINAELVPRELLTETFKVSHFPFIVKVEKNKGGEIFKAAPTKEDLVEFETDEIKPPPATKKNKSEGESNSLDDDFK